MTMSKGTHEPLNLRISERDWNESGKCTEKKHFHYNRASLAYSY